MMDYKKATRPCPGCNHPLPRKGFDKTVEKCVCGNPTCENCRFGNHCMDCYSILKGPSEIETYFSEKVTA